MQKSNFIFSVKELVVYKNSVLVYTLIGVANARYIRLSLSFDYWSYKNGNRMAMVICH